MLAIRRADDRGRSRLDWLDSRHTFAFGHAAPRGDDPPARGFRNLRVLNDDVVAPGGGFPTHPHADWEIASYVVDGALRHADSMGSAETIAAGGFQFTSAGSGVTHSEFNASTDAPVRFLQIWLAPRRRGDAPRYARLDDARASARNRLLLVAAAEPAPGAVPLGADAAIGLAVLDAGAEIVHELRAPRAAFVQVVRGRIAVGAAELADGDGAAIEDEPALRVRAIDDAEILVFDLA